MPCGTHMVIPIGISLPYGSITIVVDPLIVVKYLRKSHFIIHMYYGIIRGVGPFPYHLIPKM